MLIQPCTGRHGVPAKRRVTAARSSHDSLYLATSEDGNDERKQKDLVLPMESGRALAVAFLESAIGISTGRPVEENDAFDSLAPDESFEERVSDFHDESTRLQQLRTVPGRRRRKV